jgi:hypothetical protein
MEAAKVLQIYLWSVWTTIQKLQRKCVKRIALHGGGDTTYMCPFLPKSWKCQTKTPKKKLKLKSGIYYCRFFSNILLLEPNLV